jgi:TetR/AcrR family fatty acid metabolism transcriptional regulator
MQQAEKKHLKRTRILESAVQVFARDGLDRARISDIARGAGVGHGTVYLYFDSKDAILLTIFEELMAQVLVELRQAGGSGRDAVEKLRNVVATQARLVAENRELSALLLLEARHSRRFFQSRALDRVADYVALLGDLLREGVAEGVFRRGLDIPLAATCLYAGLEGVVTRWLLEKPTGSILDQAHAALDVLLGGISADGPCRPARVAS